MNEKIKEFANKWFDDYSPKVNMTIGMMLMHPDKPNGSIVMETLSQMAVDLDVLLSDCVEDE